MFGLLHSHRLISAGSVVEDGDVRTFRFHPETPLSWRAGQHGLLRLPGAKVKAFSIASAPEEGDVLFGTSIRSGSSFKRAMTGLAPGMSAILHGPLMDFTLDGLRPDVVMLAQGIGITPFRSMLRHLAITGTGSTAGTTSVLVHVARTAHTYRAITEADATQAQYPHSTEDFRKLVRDHIADHPDADYLIAGAATFVSDTASFLTAAGISRRRIHRDTYYGLRNGAQAPVPTTQPARG